MIAAWNVRAWLGAGALAATVLAAACGGTGSGVTPVPQTANAERRIDATHRKRGEARITIAIPRRKDIGHRMHPQYVSASTQSMTVADTGQPVQTFNLTPSSPQCYPNATTGDLTCSETAFLPTGKQRLTVSLYDQVGGKGDVLATASTIIAIAPDAATPVAITLNGVVAKVSVLIGVVGDSSVSIPQGTPTSFPLTVNAYDAKGNLIIAPGNYSPSITLGNSDKSGAVTLSTSTITAPGTPITLSYDGSGTATGATITPSVGGTPLPSGAATVAITKPLITEYSVPSSNSSPHGIALGPDKALWFAEYSTNNIGRLTTTGAVTEYPVLTSGSRPYGITSGPDGALWFTEVSGNNIGRITTTGVVTEYSIPTGTASARYITSGPDGALWFTEYIGKKIGRITTDGQITEYSLTSPLTFPEGITAGPDGALWFTEYIGNRIGRITTNGAITEYSIPTSGANPNEIVTGPNGALWFTEYSGSKIGEITTAGAITEYSLTDQGDPNGIAAGSDSALWFAEGNTDSIGRITTTGKITEYPVPVSESSPYDIVAGPDAALWFTEASEIGRIPVSIVSSARHVKRVR